MLFHASFPARNPAHAAEAVARLWNGRSYEFPVFPGSYVALEGDTHASAIEFYPAGQVLVPGQEEVEARAERPAAPSETHLAISTKLSEAEVAAIAADYGWMARRCNRGGAFDVIEFWIDGMFLIEVLTPEMQRDYAQFMLPGPYAAFLASMREAAQ